MQPSTPSLYSEKEVTLQDAIEHNLTKEEYEKICEILKRTPTVTELGIFSGMWSEHCSYKNSILLLKDLPKDSPRAIAKAGEENAGALDIGDNLVVVFKIESHNHPTAVEPFQGAATGVGGIMRDIFTMGARPICSLNSLRFGPIDNSRNRYLLRKAVEGIAFYGNCLGVAVAGGEVFFDPSYSKNCLVNAMTVGIAFKHQLAKARGEGVGNPVYYVGSYTGRDGIHGASFASQDLTKETESKRSTVQVGDPFKEKLLLEATIEAIRSGAVVGIQDMGAAGLTSSSSEMAYKGGVGIDLFLDKVPLREQGMIPYEIMLSESQERMLLIVDKNKKELIENIFNKWGLHAEEVGVVTDTKRLRIFFKNKLYGDIPVEAIANGAPRYKREIKEPQHIQKAKQWDSKSLKEPDIEELQNIFYQLLQSPNIASKKPIYEQYDQEVGLVRVQSPGGQGGIVRIPINLLEDLELVNEHYKKTINITEEQKQKILNKGIAVSTDCNSRYVYLDPYKGAQLAVFESARNIAVLGAEPIGITNCLNFGNPYKPENYFMFEYSVKGMGDACRILNIPVTGGNVSFYNESEDGAILPTPTIGMVGIIDDVKKAISPFFIYTEEPQFIYLIGNFAPTFGGSEYLWLLRNEINGQIPVVDPNTEIQLLKFLKNAYEDQILTSAADISLGGLAILLFRMAYNVWNNSFVSFELFNDTLDELKDKFKRWDLIYFGETSASIVISVKDSKETQLLQILKKYELPFYKIGKLLNNSSSLNFGLFQIDINKAKEMFESPLKPVFNYY